jgi:hypothetical protein
MVKSFIIYRQAVAEQQLIITVSFSHESFAISCRQIVAGGERRHQNLIQEKQNFLK